METNDYQIGGKHYVGHYQHWDWVYDLGIPYSLACATKYIYRWRSKNGLQDLKKAAHYICKAIDQNLDTDYAYNKRKQEMVRRFIAPCNKLDAEIITIITHGNMDLAQNKITQLIMENTNVTDI